MKTGVSALLPSRFGGVSRSPGALEDLRARYEEYFAGTGTPGEAIIASTLEEAAALARFDTVVVHAPTGFIPPKEIELLVPWLDRGFEIIVGARFFPASRLAQKRAPAPWVWAERLKAAAAGWWAGLGDGRSGFLALRKATLVKLLETDGRIDLARAAARGSSMKEVGVMWIAEKTR